MDRIFVIQRFDYDKNGNYAGQYLLDICGFFRNEYNARKYLGWYLLMKNLDYTVNEEGDYVVSETCKYSIVYLDKNFTENDN